MSEGTNGLTEWKLSEAKTRFSEVVANSQRGPQEITKGGKPVAIVISHKHLAMINPTDPRKLFAAPQDMSEAVLQALRKTKTRRKRHA